MGLLAIIFRKNCRKGGGVVPIKKMLLQFFIFFIVRKICNMFSAMTYTSVFSYPLGLPWLCCRFHNVGLGWQVQSGGNLKTGSPKVRSAKTLLMSGSTPRPRFCVLEISAQENRIWQIAKTFICRSEQFCFAKKRNRKEVALMFCQVS